jgi:two-component system, chemotaxis family, sensor kinase CheA
MSIDLSQFHSAFFDEALESLDQAEEALLCIEKQVQTGENINAAFRAIHSIKGSAGTLGFDQMTGFAHDLETVLETYRRSSDTDHLRLNDEHISLFLSALDLLRSMVGSAQQKQGNVSAQRVSVLSRKLNQIQGDLDAHDARSNLSGADDSLPPRLHKLALTFRPHPGMRSCGNDPLRYLDALAAQGTLKTTALWNANEVFSWVNQGVGHTNEPNFLHWSAILQTSRSAQEIRTIFEWIEDLCDLEIVETSEDADTDLDAKCTTGPFSDPLEELELEGPTSALDRALYQSTDSLRNDTPALQVERRREQRAIQVPSEKIDLLLGHLADLAIFQGELESKVLDQEVIELFERLGRQTRQLQDAILSMRMSPIATLFKRFERVVRDAEVELGKRVQVVIEGEQSELDSNIIERLIDPVTHLIRNALDHGLESASERADLGKPEIATLLLQAEQRGASFVLHIEEDGRGFDIRAIRAKAIQKGLANEQTERSDAQWAELIFSPGFSTAAQVNHWSGRGVGLDAVAEAIKSLNGDLQVHSTPGRGTRFSIVLPLTLALTDALIVECDDEQYAILISSIAECIQLRPADLQELPNGQKLLPLRTQLIPYALLGELMATLPLQPRPETLLGIVLRNGEDLSLLGVDRIIGQKQVVIKNIERNLGPAKYCQSATVLSAGKITFVLDSAALGRTIGTTQLVAA